MHEPAYFEVPPEEFGVIAVDRVFSVKPQRAADMLSLGLISFAIICRQ
jgi:hypothetical protein